LATAISIVPLSEFVCLFGLAGPVSGPPQVVCVLDGFVGSQVACKAAGIVAGGHARVVVGLIEGGKCPA
jgi:hypothetical protein